MACMPEILVVEFVGRQHALGLNHLVALEFSSFDEARARSHLGTDLKEGCDLDANKHAHESEELINELPNLVGIILLSRRK